MILMFFRLVLFMLKGVRNICVSNFDVDRGIDDLNDDLVVGQIECIDEKWYVVVDVGGC